MKFELVKDPELSGKECTIYQVYLEEKDDYLYNLFMAENEEEYGTELDDIDDRLYTIGHENGAREHYFKLREGKLGDLVCALYDKPNSNLRLYCIRFGMDLIVLGGGGMKPKSVRAYQEVPKLNEEAKIVKAISQAIYERQKDGELKFVNLGKEFSGNLKFGDDEE